jgi:hypothetical protein
MLTRFPGDFNTLDFGHSMIQLRPMFFITTFHRSLPRRKAAT